MPGWSAGRGPGAGQNKRSGDCGFLCPLPAPACDEAFDGTTACHPPSRGADNGASTSDWVPSFAAASRLVVAGGPPALFSGAGEPPATTTCRRGYFLSSDATNPAHSSASS